MPLVFSILFYQLTGFESKADSDPIRETIVFESGQEGYHTFRIPAIVRAGNGDLLAFAEGRRFSRSDTGDIDLILRRSGDQGRTWGPLQIVADHSDDTVGNPVPIVDARTGRVLLLTTRNDGADTQHEIQGGTSNDTRTVWIQHSDDHGATWSVSREITGQVKDSSWRWYATGPGHGIQLQRGDRAGRLIAPVTYSGPSVSAAGVIYSDDGGVTWQLGGVVRAPTHGARPSESSALELTDGQIYLNSRNRSPRQPGRAEAYSDDAGATFMNVGEAEELIDPVVQGSTVRLSATDRGDAVDRLLFSNPADLERRIKMTVRSSFDETQTWSRGRLVHAGPSAYSDLVRIDPNQGGLLYENGDRTPYERISFVAFTEAWLDDPTHPDGTTR